MNWKRSCRHEWWFAGALFFICLSPIGAVGQEATVADAFFPLSQVGRWSRPAEQWEEQKIERYRKGWVSLLRLGGRELNSAISEAGSSPPLSDHQFSQVLDRLERAPVRVCTEACRCPTTADVGCVQVKTIGPVTAEMLFIQDCALKPDGCAVSRQRHTGAAEGMGRVLLEGASRLILGSQERKALSAASKIAGGTLQVSIAVAMALPRSCPGPFPAAARSFLESAGFLRRISTFADQCALRLLEPLVSSEWSLMPKACRDFLDVGKWTALSRSGRSRAVEGLRCEGFCESLTCGNESRPVPRLLWFGSSPGISLPPDACDGGKPLSEARRAFMARAMEDLVRPVGVGGRETSERIARECREALLARSPGDEGSREKTLPSIHADPTEEASEPLFEED